VAVVGVVFQVVFVFVEGWIMEFASGRLIWKTAVPES
jgi:hypothetical protein